nr:MAG TPA: hypothetical protein [Caudoviricetes sp.]
MKKDLTVFNTSVKLYFFATHYQLQLCNNIIS